MRDRLIVAFLALTLAVVAVILVERAYATSALIQAQEQREVERSAEAFAVLLQERRPGAAPPGLQPLLQRGERLVYVDGGDRVEVTGPPYADGDDGPEPTDLTSTRDLAGGGSLTLTRDAGTVDARVADALLPLVLVGLTVMLGAALVAVWLARRLSRPFADLAEAAREIGRGRFGVEVPRSSVPEADAVARALRASARDLDGLVRRERQFAAHASHDLRTPITATRLEVEDLALSPQTPPEVVGRLTAALAQLDRLSATVTGMLDASRESRLGERVDIDLGALVRDSARRWETLAPARTIDTDVSGVIAVRMPAGSLVEVMDGLLAHAVGQGSGPIHVDVHESEAYVEVTVAEHGPGDEGAAGTPGSTQTGADLATVTEIVESLGGQLRRTGESLRSLSVVLPRAPRETLVP